MNTNELFRRRVESEMDDVFGVMEAFCVGASCDKCPVRMREPMKVQQTETDCPYGVLREIKRLMK